TTRRSRSRRSPGGPPPASPALGSDSRRTQSPGIQFQRDGRTGRPRARRTPTAALKEPKRSTARATNDVGGIEKTTNATPHSPRRTPIALIAREQTNLHGLPAAPDATGRRRRGIDRIDWRGSAPRSRNALANVPGHGEGP